MDTRQAAKAEEHRMAKDARNAGVPAFEFPANATPEQKAAMAKRAIPAGLDLEKAKATVKASTPQEAIVSDLDGAGSGATVAMPAAQKPAQNGTNGATNGAAAAANGATEKEKSPYVNGYPKAGDGEWERTGWEPRIGSLNDALGLNTLPDGADHQTWVESNLDDKFFGEWWHNAGIIAFACLSTWFITKVGLGLAWVTIVGAICATYYRTSIRRVRRNVRDDLNRELMKTKLDTDLESLEWLNSFVVKFWPIYQPVLAATVINMVDGILAGATPGFLDSLRMTTFTLGTKPPRIDHVKTYPKTEDDIVEMDWAFSFTPNDTDDLTSRQLKKKVNPKVVLEVRVGKGIISQGIPIVVEDMAFAGTMKVKIKLQLPFPHIEKVDICFMGPPKFDYALKPLGGETLGFDIGFLPGLSTFIQEQVHGNLGPMMYSPNVFTLEIAKMLGGAPIDTAIGVLAVTIHRANGLKNSDKFSGTPDPYAVVTINQRAELARTKTVHESTEPKWNETKYIILSNLNDSLDLQFFDYNEIRKDKELGVASFALEQLKTDPEHENINLPIVSNGKPRGNIMFDVRFFPVLEGRILDDGTKEPVPESNTGIARFTIHQCKDLDASKSVIGQLSPYAQMTLNSKPIFTTKIKKRNNDPQFEESHDMLITNRRTCKLGVIVKDERGFVDDPVLGKYQIKLTDLLESKEKGTEWFNLVGSKSGRVKMTCQWKPVTIKGIAGTGGYITPIGVMRLHFQSAKDLRNLEALGKSDPYVRVMLAGAEKARTVTFENDLNPAWDEVLYVPVHSAKEKLTLEVMDQESMGKDKSLGAIELSLEEFIKQDSQELYQVHAEKRNRSEGLYLGKKTTPKGTLNFTASFFPCLNVADPEEEEEEKKLLEIEKQEAEEAKKALGVPAPGSSPKIAEPVAEADMAKTPVNVAFTDADGDETDKKAPKIRLSPEELLRHDSGLIIFKFIDGALAHKDCYLEVLMDDMHFPSFSSTRIRSKNVKFDEIGDAMVRELEFSKITLRLREHGDDGEDAVLAKLGGSTLETLKMCLNNPTVLTLKDKDGQPSKVKISLKYIPVVMKLDPSESISNMGTLRVDILDAANLPAADRNGKSDPFCVFELDGKEIHKTKVQKKTLHPAWNEVFETQVASRAAAKFEVEIFDWDIGTKADFLAKTSIDLTAIEPFKPQTVVYKLKGKKGEEGKFGELRLRMVFKPDYVTRTRQGSSTFHGTFAAPGKLVTGVAGAPLKVGGAAVGGISKGASFLKKNTFGRAKSNTVSEDEPVVIEPEMQAISENRPMSSGSAIRMDGADDRLLTPTGRGSSSLSPNSAARSTSPHARSRSTSSQHSVPGVIGSGPDSGTATIRLVAASGYPAGTNVQVRIRAVDKNKDLLKSKTVKSSTGDASYDEQFSVQCFADTQFKVFVKDNHLFKDEELGEGLFAVDDTGSGNDTIVNVGEGRVTLRTSFKSAENASTADSPKASRRKGLLKK
ncbi:C2 domain-containing protein [Tricharina praecox]|uniref:C2 domain-containing protein n=1 Tax=Tricharina praecox TaxID=43433 RepID=UPI0022205D25|nr:C2 domain-containing protein [Tricharina praecox]KAI5842793.1 C2 domain-containing protein [Tricharina praecox]